MRQGWLRSLAVLGTVALVALVVIGPPARTSAAKKAEFAIGFISALSGPGIGWGMGMLGGLELAAEDVNKAGGIQIGDTAYTFRVFAAAAFLTIPIAQQPWAGLEVNVRGLQTVLEACRWQRVEKVVFSSSVAVYGNALDELVTEDTPFQGAGMQPAAALYATSKLMGEALCALYRDRSGVDYVALRYATVYGERQHYRGVNALYIVETYDRIRRGERPVIPGDGREMHDYVYAGDVARANVLAMASALGGERVNIATGIGTSINDLVAVLLRLTGSDRTPEYRSDSGRVRSASSTHLRFSREKAARLLGWIPEVGLDEGIARLIAWREGRQAPVPAGGGF